MSAHVDPKTTRPCPSCNKTLAYSNIAGRRRAEQRNTLCNKCRRWEQNDTKAAANFVKYHHALGLNDVEIAAKLGKHKSYVKHIRDYLDLPPNKRQPKKLNRVSATEALCSRCEQVLPVEDFYSTGSQVNPGNLLSFCKRCEYQHATRKQYDIRWACKQRIAELRVRARRTEIPFSLTADYLLMLWEMQEGRCFYTDLPMLIHTTRGQQNAGSMSVDRIIPERGYVEENVVLCLTRVNYSKSNISLSEMAEWMPEWYRRITVLHPELSDEQD